MTPVSLRVAKKHSRIIKYLFWPLIISFVQEASNNKISLFGLRLLNMLIANEATHEQILQMGQTKQVNEQHQIFQRSLVEQKFNNPGEDELSQSMNDGDSQANSTRRVQA